MAEALIDFDLPKDKSSIIKVVGVGGGGGNAINYMFTQGITDVDFVICNTDQQALVNSPIPIKIQLGETLTQGRGAGNKPEQGRQAAIESLDQISEVLSHNTKMVFITAGMGGGTGTGAAPVIAAEAKDLGILTVAIVTLPFRFEGKRRITQAIEGLNELKNHVDALLVINNERLREIYGDLPVSQAFSRADNILTVAAKGIAEIITVHGSVNVDFADVQTVMTNSGVALMGSATASGEGRAMQAIEEALNSPLLNENDIRGAKNILLNISSGPLDEVRMDEIGEITDFIQESAGMTADIIWGNNLDERLGDKISITIIATGFGSESIPELSNFEPVAQPVVKTLVVPKEEEILSKPKQEHFVAPEPEITFEVIDRSTPVDDPRKPEPEVERYDLFSEPAQRSSAQPEIDWGVFQPSENTEMKFDKMTKPKVSYSNESDIEELENVPAYLRKKVELDPMEEITPGKKEVSRYTLSDTDGEIKLNVNNSFLHDPRD